MKLFQSTLPRRERPSWEILSVRRRYFNPRSREGSDPREELIASRCIISIHAPAKGATDLCGRRHGGVLISIHAPAKGATTFSTWVDEALEFQSTLPRRERHYVNHNAQPINDFNPRSREGSDAVCHFGRGSVGFQSTLPRRERRRGRTTSLPFPAISIHAPAKGATHS